MRTRQDQLLCQGPCYSYQTRDGGGSCVPFKKNVFRLALVHWAVNNMRCRYGGTIAELVSMVQSSSSVCVSRRQ